MSIKIAKFTLCLWRMYPEPFYWVKYTLKNLSWFPREKGETRAAMMCHDMHYIKRAWHARLCYRASLWVPPCLLLPIINLKEKCCKW